jgi:hypothetical protein
MYIINMDDSPVQDSLDASTLEKILLNLKMVALIKANDKLYLDTGLLKIDTPAIMQGISRWMNEYSRLKTMEDIDLLINKTNNFVDSNFEKNERTEEDNRDCQKILVEVSKSVTGIQNLKITYREDTFIQSKLDVINDNILEIKNKLSRRLNIS